MFQTVISYPDLVPINPAPRFPLSKIMTPPHDDDTTTTMMMTDGLDDTAENR